MREADVPEFFIQQQLGAEWLRSGFGLKPKALRPFSTPIEAFYDIERPALNGAPEIEKSQLEFRLTPTGAPTIINNYRQDMIFNPVVGTKEERGIGAGAGNVPESGVVE